MARRKVLKREAAASAAPRSLAFADAVETTPRDDESLDNLVAALRQLAARMRERADAAATHGEAAVISRELQRVVSFESALAPGRERFLRRLKADAITLADCRRDLVEPPTPPLLQRIRQMAHALVGAGGIYGFAAVSGAAAALSQAAGKTPVASVDVAAALDGLLERISAL